jgi:hypothetical protein
MYAKVTETRLAGAKILGPGQKISLGKSPFRPAQQIKKGSSTTGSRWKDHQKNIGRFVVRNDEYLQLGMVYAQYTTSSSHPS